jgi:hypothetical protein
VIFFTVIYKPFKAYENNYHGTDLLEFRPLNAIQLLKRAARFAQPEHGRKPTKDVARFTISPNPMSLSEINPGSRTRYGWRSGLFNLSV